MPELPSTTFGLLLAATVLACALTLVKAFRDHRWLGLPAIAAFFWLYFYVYMAWKAATSLHDYLPTWAMELGQLVAVTCFLALMLGWLAGMRRKQAAPAQRTGAKIDYRKLYFVGIFACLVGALSFQSFLSQEELSYEKTSAYWYLAFHLSYPGMALALLAHRQDRRVGTKFHLVILLAVTALALLPHVSHARRGPVFPAAAIYLVLPTMVGARRPSRAVVMGGLVAVGAVMLLFVAVRPWLYQGGETVYASNSGRAANWSIALSEVSADDVIQKRAQTIEDNEYVYHCGMIGTNVEREIYQYGTGYLTLFTHWIPRTWWPAKPNLGQGWFPDILKEIPIVMGWSLTSGAAAGGLAEVFNQFGWGSLLFWFLVGFLASRQFRRAENSESPLHLMSYLGLLCASHWLVAQGFAEAFVPTCVYQTAPLAALWVCRAKGLQGSAARLAVQGGA